MPCIMLPGTLLIQNIKSKYTTPAALLAWPELWYIACMKARSK